MKKLSIIILLLALTLTLNANKIYIIYFGDTGDANIGRAIQTDMRLMDKIAAEIKSVATSEGYTCVYKKYVGCDCSSSKLKSVINALSCNGDIVFFYYGGHGGRSHEDNSQFPRMCLSSNNVDEFVKVSDVMEQLNAKHPRLYVMVTDCCNSYYDRKREAVSNLIESYSIDKSLRQLLFKQTGYVSLTAASPGEYGWCNPDGSFLTVSMISHLKLYNSKNESNITWNAICREISSDVKNKTTKLYQLRTISNYQTPIYEIGIINDSNSNDGIPPSVDDNDTDINVSDTIDSNINNDVINNRIHDNNNHRVHNNSHHNGRKPHRNLLGLILFAVAGCLLVLKVSDWLDLDKKASIIVKIIGGILIIKAFINMMNCL